jgi:hypothetical protein
MFATLDLSGEIYGSNHGKWGRWHGNSENESPVWADFAHMEWRTFARPDIFFAGSDDLICSGLKIIQLFHSINIFGYLANWHRVHQTSGSTAFKHIVSFLLLQILFKR